jgi:hypothetical protein
MVWTDPSKLTVGEIEAKIPEISTEVRQAVASGGKLGELSSKLWRLQAEAQFRQRRDG